MDGWLVHQHLLLYLKRNIRRWFLGRALTVWSLESANILL